MICPRLVGVLNVICPSDAVVATRPCALARYSEPIHLPGLREAHAHEIIASRRDPRIRIPEHTIEDVLEAMDARALDRAGRGAVAGRPAAGGKRHGAVLPRDIVHAVDIHPKSLGDSLRSGSGERHWHQGSGWRRGSTPLSLHIQLHLTRRIPIALVVGRNTATPLYVTPYSIEPI